MANIFEKLCSSISRIYPQSANEIFHYTNLGGLQGIIKNKNIWATHYQYLNDKGEFEFGKELVCNWLNQAQEKETNNEIADLFKWLRLNLQDGSYEKFDLYIACFSEDDDSHSQWNIYGDDGKGYILGFDIGGNSGLEKEYLLKVLYGLEEQKEIFDQFIHTVQDILNSHGLAEHEHNDAFNAMWHHVKVLSAIFKSPSFRKEREWRLIYNKKHHASLEDIVFRTRHAAELIPYTELPLAFSSNNNFPIKSVRVGPLVTKEGKTAVELFLKKYKLDKVNVCCSQIPYRP